MINTTSMQKFDLLDVRLSNIQREYPYIKDKIAECRSIIKQLYNREKKYAKALIMPHGDDLFSVLAKALGFSTENVKGRKKEDVEKRYMVAALLMQSGYTHAQAAKVFERDRTTMYYYQELHENRLFHDAHYRIRYENAVKQFELTLYEREDR